MTVTPVEIAAALGRPTPAQDSPSWAQWSLWISDALMLIEARLGDPALLDQAKLDYVVREAVVAQVRRPDDATSVDIAVDDGRVSKRYSSGSGRVVILDEWWALLDPDGSARGRAFMVDARPRSSAWSAHQPWCNMLMGANDCSCGAYLTREEYPLWEGGVIS